MPAGFKQNNCHFECNFFHICFFCRYLLQPQPSKAQWVYIKCFNGVLNSIKGELTWEFFNWSQGCWRVENSVVLDGYQWALFSCRLCVPCTLWARVYTPVWCWRHLVTQSPFRTRQRWVAKIHRDQNLILVKVENFAACSYYLVS